MSAPLSTDEQLLAALGQRLEERRVAQEESAWAASKLRELNTRLEAAERLKSQFLSNIRNEINNPLTAMRGFAAAIADNPALSAEQVRAMAATMHREVNTLAFQMQNIFTAADLECGLLQPERARVNVTELIGEVIVDFRREAQRRGVLLTTKPAPPTIAMTDASLLDLMVSNLVANAIAFTPEGGAVELRIAAGPEEMVLEVEDEGPGIAPENVEKIFDRFVQLSTGSTKIHPGHGLGLSVVRACAELLGGRVETKATRGSGSIFRLMLPRSQETEWPESATPGDDVSFEAVEAF